MLLSCRSSAGLLQALGVLSLLPPCTLPPSQDAEPGSSIPVLSSSVPLPAPLFVSQLSPCALDINAASADCLQAMQQEVLPQQQQQQPAEASSSSSSAMQLKGGGWSSDCSRSSSSRQGQQLCRGCSAAAAAQHLCLLLYLLYLLSCSISASSCPSACRRRGSVCQRSPVRRSGRCSALCAAQCEWQPHRLPGV